MQSIQKLFACSALIVSAFAPTIAMAQTALGSDCETLALANTQQVITLTQAVAADQWIIVSVAANSTFVQFASNSVTDSAGNGYSFLDNTVMAAGSGALTTFAGHVVTALDVGDQITLTYQANGSSSTQGCVEAAAFSGVLVQSDPVDTLGESFGNGATQSVVTDTPTQYARDMVYSVFASAATPGLMVATSPAQAIEQVCSGDGTLCLLPAWNTAAAAAGNPESADAGSDNAVNWGALIIAFRNEDGIFADGFEGSP